MTANPEPEERLRALAMALRIVAPLINSTPKFSPDGMELLVGDLGDLLDELARLRATLAEAEQPQIFWLSDDPETGLNNVEDFADMIDVGGVARIDCAHTLPGQWAAHVLIPATDERDEESEIQLFATETEARAALHTAEDTQ